MKAFEKMHPVIPMIYFSAMIFITMFTVNPDLLAVSFFGAVSFCGMLVGARKLASSLAYSVPVLLLISLTNPIFSHNGETILFFMNDNPVTLEAVCYGFAVGVMIMSVFYWFKCFNAVMSSDKFIYLFGRVIPKLALLLSMTLGFIPKLKRRYKEIDSAQKALGIYTSKSFVDRLRSKMRVMSILVTWSLESSVETGDSMRARGYGLKGRSSYSVFAWSARDSVVLAVILVFVAAVCFAMSCGYGEFSYYPAFSPLDLSPYAVALYAALTALAWLSTVIEIKENILWQSLRSKI